MFSFFKSKDMQKLVMVLWMLMVLIFGCGPEQDKIQQDDAHEHSDELIQITSFSDNIEFFIEYESLEAGHQSALLVHLTGLATYKPMPEGSVSLRIDGNAVSSGQPVRPGIFEVLFTPESTGDFPAELTYQRGSQSESVEFGVRVNGHPETLHAEETGPEGEITFVKEYAWESDFMVEQVKPVLFSSVIPTSGEILAVPGEKKHLAAQHQGMVHFTDPKLVQGSSVSKGQVLFSIRSDQLIDHNVKLQFEESLNLYEKSKSEYERYRKLYAQGAISERQLINSRTVFMEDSLRMNNLRTNGSAEGFRVVAPVSGTIHELCVSEGSFLETGRLMATISSNKVLLIRADLSQQFYGQLKEIETANFRPAYTTYVYSIEEMNGRLLAAGASVAENDHYLPIIFEVENDGSLLEGAFTEVFLKTKGKSNALIVPLTAISEEQGKHFVYIQISGESYTKRAVTPGRNDGRTVEILQGISAGERLVTKGVMLVKAASVAAVAVSHGHTH
jgi:cobalt-zinc-cadmium efflux system membrane fusion protein